jgi:succinoglycan biosynthesis protein ExoA
MESAMPRVSVIVPVRNESAHIRRTLAGLANQSLPTDQYEILVVDGQSEDGTPDIVREVQASVPNLFLFENPRRLSSAARNVGIRESRGDFVLVVDGHCEIADRDHLANVIAAFESSGADTLGRPQPLRTHNPTSFQQAVSAARQSWLGHNPDSAIFSDRAAFVPPDNVAVAYRREVFDRVGLFDESFDACEDVEFNTRVRQAGMTCYFTPAIAVDYQPRASVRGLAFQMIRYGRGRARLAQKTPSTVTLPSLVPPVWVAWAVIGAGLSPFSALIALVWAVSVALYLAVVLGESGRLSWHRSGPSFPRLPVIFAAVHVGFAWGYWKETCSGLGRGFATRVRLPTRQLASAARPRV